MVYRGAPYEFGRRVYAEALRRGLMQAQRVYAVADGAVWIWNIVADRFPGAVGGLDFYHAAQHLWAVAHDQFGESGPEASAWVEPLLHQLKHGGEAGVLATLSDLLELCAEHSKTLEREVEYFHSDRDDPPPRAPSLPRVASARLPHRLGVDGIHLQPISGPLQTHGSVLDPPGRTAPNGSRAGAPQQRLG